MGSDESHFYVSVGSDGQSHRTVSTNHNLFEEKGEPKRYRTEVLPLTSLTPYHKAKPAHMQFSSGNTFMQLSLAVETPRCRHRPALHWCICRASGKEPFNKANELCESRGGRPGLPVPNSPYGLCGRKATFNVFSVRAQELCERRGGCPGLPVPNKPDGFCGREATLKRNFVSELRSCVKDEVAVLASPSLISLMVSADVKQH